MIIKLLKNIFSANVIAVILTAASLYFAYRTFFRDNNGTVSVVIEHGDNDKEYQIGKMNYIMELVIYKGKDIHSSGYYWHYPIFRNKTNNSVDDIEILSFVEDYDDIDYEINFSDYRNEISEPDSGPDIEIPCVSNFDKIKAFNDAPYFIESVNPQTEDAEILIIHRITYKQINEPEWIVTYTQFARKDDLVSDEKYMEKRNDFLEEAKDNYQEPSESFSNDKIKKNDNNKNVCLIVGDTMVYVTNPLFYRKDYDISQIKSLDELGKMTILKD